MTNTLSYYQTCPNCQSKLDKTISSAKCPNCDFVFYLNPAPCVIILIVNDKQQILWTIRGIDPAKNHYDFPGGFIDPDETAEQAVIREAKEELSVDVKITRYLGNVPDLYGELNQPTLNFIYLAEIIEGQLKAQDDVSRLEWIDLDKPPSPIAFKNATIALDIYREYGKGNHE